MFIQFNDSEENLVNINKIAKVVLLEGENKIRLFENLSQCSKFLDLWYSNRDRMMEDYWKILDLNLKEWMGPG